MVPMKGSDRLRENIAALYNGPDVTKDSILTTNGGIVANQIVLQSLLAHEDHVIVMYPTYEELYQTPRMLGAEVTFGSLSFQGRAARFGIPSIVNKEITRMIVLNSPNNPTGAHLSLELQREIVRIAEEHDLIISCDEVFYPLFRLGDPDCPQSFLDLEYEKTVVIGSLSKAYSLAGTRTGWIASTNKEIL